MSTLRIGRRRSAILPTLVIVAVLVVVFAIFTSVWTDRLWYQSFDYGTGVHHDAADPDRPVRGLRADHGRLRGRQRGDRLPAAAAAGHGQPASPLLERYRELLESRFVWVTRRSSAVLVGLFAGGTASGQVFNYLAWRNATAFNVDDPQFGLDVSFFVFGYPWWRFVAVVRVRRAGRERDRRGGRALHDGRPAASAAGAAAAAERPRPTCPS